MTIKQIQTQIVKGQKALDIVKRGYNYTVDGEYWTGVTTILSVKAKDFLKWWTVKMMYEFMRTKLKSIKEMTEVEYEALLIEGKKAHTKRTGDAQDIGKKGHKLLEIYIQTKLEGRESTLEIDNKKMQKTFDSFIKWESDNDVEWVASEVIVGNREHKFAGTLDALAFVDGKLTLIDFKFSNQLSEDVFLQTAAYQLCLEEMGVKPERRMAIRLPKDGKDIEPLPVKTPLDFDKEVFIGLRQTHRWNLYVLNNLKDNFGKLKMK